MYKKILLFSALLISILFTVLYATGHGYIITAFSRTWMIGNETANINDAISFKTRTIKTGKTQTWPQHAQYNKTPLPVALDEHLKKYRSAAFLVVHKGQLLNEHYFNSYTEKSRTNSFSMAKTVLTMLVGIAIKEGYIDSFDQPIIDFLPEFKGNQYAPTATIAHLSSMTSGYAWDEDYYSAFSPTVKLLYGDDIEQFVLSGDFDEKPGSQYYYSSASTQLLGILLKRALTKQLPNNTLSDYLSTALWQPLGMNDDAQWHLDDRGMELTFCCINSNARNFAKLGQLLLNQGQWQGVELIPSQFVQTMLQPDKVAHYGYSTWLNKQHTPNFYSFTGHLGQYIINVPDHDLVIVRLGETWPSDTDFQTKEVPFLVQQTLQLINVPTTH